LPFQTLILMLLGIINNYGWEKVFAVNAFMSRIIQMATNNHKHWQLSKTSQTTFQKPKNLFQKSPNQNQKRAPNNTPHPKVTHKHTSPKSALFSKFSQPAFHLPSTEKPIKSHKSLGPYIYYICSLQLKSKSLPFRQKAVFDHRQRL